MERGSRIFDMSNRLEWTGSLEAITPVLAAAETFTHTVSLVCFAAGAFKVSCQCRKHQPGCLWTFGDDPNQYRLVMRRFLNPSSRNTSGLILG
jgi:hypothetical protein